MNRNDSDDLEAAFEFISDFKAHGIDPGSDISAQQLKLLRLLRADLLPSEPHLDDAPQKLVLRVAEEDTRWNHKTMGVIEAIYSMRSAGRDVEGDALRQAFLRDCPSQWYKDIVNAA